MTADACDRRHAGLLDDYGWTPEVSASVGPVGATEQPGRVVRTDHGAVLVATAHTVLQVDLPPGFAPVPVAGDWLLLTTTEPLRPRRVVDRRTTLVRRDEHKEQALAANVDGVFVVCSLDRPVVEGQLSRALVLSHDSGAEPVVVLTKADMCADSARVAAATADVVPGVEVVVASSLDKRGVDVLQRHLGPGRTFALIGESGVGKSSLANALVGRAVQLTGEVRERDRQGRHTTRARHLVPVGGGATLVDTPGLRAFGVVGMHAGLARTFADVSGVTNHCRFTDCTHEREPGCALTTAVRSGRLAAARVERYRQLSEATDPPPRRTGRGRTGR